MTLIGCRFGISTKNEIDSVALLIYVDGTFHPPNMPSPWAQTILGDEGPKRHWAGIWLYDAGYDRIIASWLLL